MSVRNDSPTVQQSLAEHPEGALTRTLQSTSPGGLAHSALAALRRGETPTPESQASLDAVLTWREAWETWFESYVPWHTLVSRTDAAISTATEAKWRADVARSCVTWYGGPLGKLTEGDAAFRLRGAFAQHQGLVGADEETWQLAMLGAKTDVESHYDSSSRRPQQALDPRGLTYDDLPPFGHEDENDLPREPLIAASAKVNRKLGLVRAARRWATAVATPILAAESAARAAADAAVAAFAQADPLEMIGAEAIAALVEAHTEADSAGVRVHEHQADTVNAMRSLIEDTALRPAGVAVDL